MMLSKFYSYENEDEINVDLKCAICFEPFRSPFCNVNCGHTFCFQCLKTWFQQKQTCPICRRYFTKFIRMTDEKRRNELNDLFVQCLQCNQKHIRRSQFGKHLISNCSKQILFDDNDFDNDNLLEQYLNDAYSMNIDEIDRLYRRYYRNNHQVHTDSLPFWFIFMSSTHLIIYMSVLIPLVIIFYLADKLICPVLYTISYLIRLIRIDLERL